MFREIKEKNGEACDTIFYQGIGASQTHITKYRKEITLASTGESMWCTGKNNLKPMHAIYSPHIGPEIADINLNPFPTVFHHLNPIKTISYHVTSLAGWYNGMHFAPALNPTCESVRFHAPNVSKISIGQELDMTCHRQKYESWKQQDSRSKNLILWGVSRGTSATFCAIAKEKYAEVKLVVLEGAIDSVENVLHQRAKNLFGENTPSSLAESVVRKGLNFFSSYRSDGPSPLKSVSEFPEKIPVVFITSEIDTIVPCVNTENIATALAKRGKNDVFLLKLKKSSHPNYMFDDKEDRDSYEAFIHAVYKRYHLKHEPELAKKGEEVLAKSILSEARESLMVLKA